MDLRFRFLFWVWGSEMGGLRKASLRLFTPIVLTFIFLFTVLAFIFPPFSTSQTNPHPRSLHVIVVKVSDGDTVQGETPEKAKLKIRLYGIDAPEIAHGNIPGQPVGEESLVALKNKLLNKEVRVDILDVDRHRRIVAMLWLGSRNINLEMVKEGYAEAYREYLKNPYRQEFLDAEREAKAAKRGIWALANYERPCAFKARARSRVN